jgi:hypothetical protein
LGEGFRIDDEGGMISFSGRLRKSVFSNSSARAVLEDAPSGDGWAGGGASFCWAFASAGRGVSARAATPKQIRPSQTVTVLAKKTPTRLLLKRWIRLVTPEPSVRFLKRLQNRRASNGTLKLKLANRPIARVPSGTHGRSAPETEGLAGS